MAITPDEVQETLSMVSQQHLDIRTITMGISLMGCADQDMARMRAKTYDHITRTAEHLVETADARTIFRNPCHPYTRGLIDSIPRPGARGEALHTIPGAPPQLYDRSDACPYMARCPHAAGVCDARPEAVEVEPGHIVSCHIAACHCVKGGALHG